MSENKQQSGVKKFFTSKIFKWILILILEFVSMFIFQKVFMASGDFLSKPVLIYLGVCIVLSIGTLTKIGRFRKRSERDMNKGVIHIMSERQYQEKQMEKGLNFFMFMALACLILAPFAAPVSLGTIIHMFLCKILGR